MLKILFCVLMGMSLLEGSALVQESMNAVTAKAAGSAAETSDTKEQTAIQKEARLKAQGSDQQRPR